MLPFKGSPTYVEKKSSKISNNIVPGKEMSCVCVCVEKKRNGFPIYFFPYRWTFAKKSRSIINV